MHMFSVQNTQGGTWMCNFFQSDYALGTWSKKHKSAPMQGMHFTWLASVNVASSAATMLQYWLLLWFSNEQLPL